MIKTTVYFDEETALALRRRAFVEHRSQAAIIRQAVVEYVGHSERPVPPGIGAYRSGRSDISTRAEELLATAARERRGLTRFDRGRALTLIPADGEP